MWKLSIAVSILLASLAVSIANAALPELSRYFKLGFTEVRWVVLSYLISNTLLIVVGSHMGDIFGRRRMLVVGTLVFSASSLLAASSIRYESLIVSRAVQGAGGALLISMSLALLGDLAVKGKLGSTIGIAGSMSAAGTLLGPSLGTLLLYEYGWRSLFIFLGAAGFINSALIFKFVPDSKSKPGSSSLTFEKFRNLKIGANLARNTVVSSIMMTTTVVGPFFLINNLKLSVIEMGLVMSVGPLTSLIMGYASGFIADRFGAEKVSYWGLIVLLLGTIAFARFPSVFATLGYTVATVILSIGYQLFLAANNTLVISSTSSSDRGLASGLLGFSRNLGLLAGTGILGAVFAVFGLEVVFLFSALLILFIICSNKTFRST